MPVTFGIHVGQQSTTIDELRRLWTYADTHGFGWLSVWDHFYNATDETAPHYEAVALLAAIACETRNLRFGCMVFAAPYRNLGLLAKSMITIDHLSGGRLEFGMGGGWHEPEFRAFGYDFPPIKQRLDLLEEGMQAMRGFLDHETTDHHGPYFQFTDARMAPRPLGRLPLWIGGRGERRTAHIAARYADGWNIPYESPESLVQKYAALDRWCEVEGRDPTTIARATQLGFYMAAAADPASLAHAETEMYRRVPPHQDMVGQLTGSPAQVTERLHAYEAAGITAINIAIRPPVDWAALDAFVTEVMPHFT